ncbi:MAG: GNAT family N-acetyltransferase, partial [Pseudomonadota bacterium]
MTAPPRIETARLTMTPPTLADLSAYKAFYAVSDVTVGGYRGRRSDEEVRSILARDIDHWAAKGFGMFLLRRKGEAEVVGGTGLAHPDDWPSHELTWWLMPDARGGGLATEASRAVIDWAYRDLGWSVVETHMRDENAPARNLAARLGGVVDRRDMFPDGVARDVFTLPHPDRPLRLFPERLETERLVLRRPAASDRAAYTAYCVGDRSGFAGGPSTAEAATKSFYALMGQWDARGYGRWGRSVPAHRRHNAA